MKTMTKKFSSLAALKNRARRLLPAAAAVAAMLPLAGCGNISGLIDAHDEFGCGSPGRASCASLSETYAHERAADEAQSKESAKAIIRSRSTEGAAGKGNFENAPKAAAAKEAENTVAKTDESLKTAGVLETQGLTESAAQALARSQKKVDARMRALKARAQTLPARAPEKVVMLWVLPWVDAEGDLHGDSRLWVRVKDALWRIERVRSRAMQSVPSGVEP